MYHVSKPTVEQNKEAIPFIPLNVDDSSQEGMDHRLYPERKEHACVVDWLVQMYNESNVLDRNRMCSGTLQLAILLLDNFCVATEIPNDYHELVGLACLVIASKVGDIEPADPIYLASRCHQPFTWNEIVVMENTILTTLNFHP
eukprot:scaffold41588_cov51-Attheya_sp.AAC.3